MTTLGFTRKDWAVSLIFIAYAASSIVEPMVLVDMAKELNFPLDEGGMAEGGLFALIRAFTMCITLVLSGFVAARYGKVPATAISTLIIGIGVSLAGLSSSYFMALCLLSIAGIGEGIVEGLATPIVQDNHPEGSGRCMNIVHGFWPAGIVATTLLVGFWITSGGDWRVCFYVTGACAIPGGLLLLWPSTTDPARATSETVSARDVMMHTKVIVRSASFWRLFGAMIMAGIGEMCLTYWTPSYLRLVSGQTALGAGFGTTMFAGGMLAGRMLSGWFVSQKHLPALIIILGIASVIFSTLFPYLSSNIPLYALLFCIGGTMGPFWPSIQSHGAHTLAVDSTMLMILLSCAGVPGGGIGAWLSGVLGDQYGMRIAMLLAPASFFLMTVLMIWDEVIRRRTAEA